MDRQESPVKHKRSNNLSICAAGVNFPAQVFFRRPVGRKWESSNSSHLRISDLSASSNDPDTHQKPGFELLTSREWGDGPETQAASGFCGVLKKDLRELERVRRQGRPLHHV